MAHSAIQIANYFIEKGMQEGISISPMKLQKLLFFAHGWFLALCDKPLIKERFQVWKNGPVVPSVYHEFKQWGNTPILEQAFLPHDETGSSELESVSLQILEAVWDAYKDKTAIRLSNMTHLQGTPWKNKYDETIREKGFLPANIEMEDEMIKDYFKENISNGS